MSNNKQVTHKTQPGTCVGTLFSAARLSKKASVTSITSLASGVLVLVWVLIANCCLTGSALAATVTNKDNRSHDLTRIGAVHPQQFHVQPGARVEKVCPTGCVLRLDGSTDNDYRIEGNERFSIEEGTLYYDGERSKKDEQAPQGREKSRSGGAHSNQP